MKTWLWGAVGLLAAMAAGAGPVDINSADAETLARELDGVGLARARAIVEYRDRVGRFASAEQLMDVSGIGRFIVDRNRENIVVGEAAP